MKIEERRERKPRIRWERPANWQTVLPLKYGGPDPVLEVVFVAPRDAATDKQTDSGYRLSGTRADFEHLQAVLQRLLG